MKTFLTQCVLMMLALAAFGPQTAGAQRPGAVGAGPSAASPRAPLTFAQAVRGVSGALHTPPRHRRWFGASQLVILGAVPVGSRNVHLAVFDLAGEPSAGERAAVSSALQGALGPPWQLLAHRTSQFGERESWVYVRAGGSQVTTVVCLIERGQATVVMADADPQAVLDSLQQPGIVLWGHQSVARGLWGGLGDGSGFGPGVAFATPSGPLNLAQLHGSVQVTYRDYFKSTLGVRLDPTGGDMQTFSLDLTGRYQVSPDVDFFGVGPDSPAQRAIYDLQTRGLALTLGVRPARGLDITVGEGYAGNRVFGGREGVYANAQAVFSASLVPGLARGANLVRSFGSIQYDTRDYPESPHRGLYLRLSASDNNGTGHSNFGFWHYAGDLRGYVPLTRFSDVLAWRGLSVWNIAKPGETVPFFEMSRLGDSSLLRGYRPYRFYGLNAVASSLEYRHFFTTDFGAFLFGDLGQVYDTRSELTRSNLRATWGVGLLFNDSRRKTSFKIYFGITRDEGHRWFMTKGPPF